MNSITVKNEKNIYMDDIHVADFTLDKTLPNTIGFELEINGENISMQLMCVPVIELDDDKKRKLQQFLKTTFFRTKLFTQDI